MVFNTKINTEDLIKYFKVTKFNRTINQVHIHHTASPSYKNFTGNNHETLNSNMKSYHINTNGWADIGQHFTLFPDGVWLVGRDINVPPASISGHNTGAVCIEMLGNFNKGNDVMRKEQKEAIYKFVGFLVKELGLTMYFHRDFPEAGNKECPGTSINKEEFLNNSINAYKNTSITNLMTKYNTKFKDMILSDGTAHWANETVNFLVGKGVIAGSIEESTGDLIFRPNEPATRAEIATMIYKAYQSILNEIKKG